MESINKWFIHQVKEHYLDFDGRVTREAFWMFVLWSIVLSFLFSIVDRMLGMRALDTLYSLAILIPSLAITTRRLHDVDKSGWWQLLWIVPIVGWIILVVFLVGKGVVGANHYGADPLGVQSPIPPAAGGMPNQAPAPVAPAQQASAEQPVTGGGESHS